MKRKDVREKMFSVDDSNPALVGLELRSVHRIFPNTMLHADMPCKHTNARAVCAMDRITPFTLPSLAFLIATFFHLSPRAVGPLAGELPQHDHADHRSHRLRHRLRQRADDWPRVGCGEPLLAAAPHAGCAARAALPAADAGSQLQSKQGVPRWRSGGDFGVRFGTVFPCQTAPSLYAARIDLPILLQMSIIDINGVLTFFDLTAKAPGGGANTMGEHLSFERKVWLHQRLAMRTIACGMVNCGIGDALRAHPTIPSRLRLHTRHIFLPCTACAHPRFPLTHRTRGTCAGRTTTRSCSQ